MQENLFEVQGAVASGLRIEIAVPRDLVGIIIGKKGSRIQEVQRETGVTDIHIDGESGGAVPSCPPLTSLSQARSPSVAPVLVQFNELESYSTLWKKKFLSQPAEEHSSRGIFPA
jgi:hypothetical protein